jgi:hypothetical protein
VHQRRLRAAVCGNADVQQQSQRQSSVACAFDSVDPSSADAIAHEILLSLLPPPAPPPSDSPLNGTPFSTDPLPPPPLHLPVLKVLDGGIDCYDPCAPQFALECMHELQDKGVLVLDCGLEDSLPAILHHASTALTRCVTCHMARNHTALAFPSCP